ncbi:MAG: type 1 glutamine amidotransferase [Limisphaerales bacterium]|jgi:type 1 glutamine amidotransferase
MKSIRIVLTLLLLISAAGTHAAKSVKPLRALIITGGCCHDYPNQKLILSKGISARANISFDVIHEGGTAGDHKVGIYSKKNWADQYDVIVHNECFGKVLDVKFINAMTQAHKAGTPAVVIHCSIHSYRRAETDEWRKVMGVSSLRHQQKTSVEVKNLKPKHPIMKEFPASWKTPNGELYEIVKVWDTCTPLASAYGVRTKEDHPCVWINEYGKGRTFGTTLGHHNETMDNETYLGLVTRGLLWACGKLDANGKPKAGYGPQK